MSETIEADIVLDGWNVPRNHREAGDLHAYLLRMLTKKVLAQPRRDWMKPAVRLERRMDGTVRYIMETRAREPIAFDVPGEPLLNK